MKQKEQIASLRSQRQLVRSFLKAIQIASSATPSRKDGSSRAQTKRQGQGVIASEREAISFVRNSKLQIASSATPSRKDGSLAIASACRAIRVFLGEGFGKQFRLLRRLRLLAKTVLLSSRANAKRSGFLIEEIDMNDRHVKPLLANAAKPSRIEVRR